MNRRWAGVLMIVFAFSLPHVSAMAADEQDTPQVTTVRAMHKVLAAGDWKTFYDKHTHPHLKRQLTAERFAKYMEGKRGEAIVALYAEVIRLVDADADETELLAQHEDDKSEYEFILVKLHRMDRAQRNGRQWHLELGLDKGEWKLRDTD